MVASLLVACPGPPGPYYGPGESFNLILPDDAGSNLRASFVWFDADNKAHTIGSGYVGSGGKDGASGGVLYVYAGELEKLARNPQFVTAFVGGETQEKSEVTVTPGTARTGNLYPIVWRDLNSDNRLSGEGEVVYDTHDRYSYATESFTYSFRLPNGRAVESGTRLKGWSRVKHLVLQPSEAPGEYMISMNSVTGKTFRMHEPSDYASSMSVKETP